MIYYKKKLIKLNFLFYKKFNINNTFRKNKMKLLSLIY